MQKIQKYVDGIAEELNGAKEYIETALEYKVMGNTARYTKYKEMSVQELGHASNLHEMAVQDIEQLKTVYPDVPQRMMDKWNHAHKDFIEKTAWIKQMQSM